MGLQRKGPVKKMSKQGSLTAIKRKQFAVFKPKYDIE